MDDWETVIGGKNSVKLHGWKHMANRWGRDTSVTLMWINNWSLQRSIRDKFVSLMKRNKTQSRSQKHASSKMKCETEWWNKSNFYSMWSFVVSLMALLSFIGKEE